MAKALGESTKQKGNFKFSELSRILYHSALENVISWLKFYWL